MTDFNYLLVNPSAGDTYFLPINGEPSTGNVQVVNSGSAMNIGTSSTTINNVGLSLTDQSLYGAQLATGLGRTAGAVPGGTNFATMEAAFYIMARGGAQSEHIHGDSGFTTLRGVANFGTKTSIHNTKIIRSTLTATAIRNNQWSQVSGVFTTNPLVNPSGMYDANGNADLVGTGDSAANPTQFIPGELVYKESKPLPEQDDYKERFLW